MLNRTSADSHPLFPLLQMVQGQNRLQELTMRQTALLLYLKFSRTDAQRTIRHLASLLKVQKPVITRAVNTLGSLGFVRRVPDEHDRRNVFIHITEAGELALN